MKGRCHNKKHVKYKDYGKRGISVCDEWRQSKWAFIKYVKTLPNWDNPDLELNRIDNNGNYKPGNVEWATKAENRRNTRPRMTHDKFNDLQTDYNKLLIKYVDLLKKHNEPIDEDIQMDFEFLMLSMSYQRLMGGSTL
jgi:hypothetical protein